MNHFQKQGKIHINQKKQQNPRKIAQIMKKNGFLVSFILGGVLAVFQNDRKHVGRNLIQTLAAIFIL